MQTLQDSRCSEQNPWERKDWEEDSALTSVVNLVILRCTICHQYSVKNHDAARGDSWHTNGTKGTLSTLFVTLSPVSPEEPDR